MRIAQPLAVIALVTASIAARAQAASFYVTVPPSHFSNVETGAIATLGNSFAPTYGSYWTTGIGGGVTAGFLPLGPIHLGLDLRGSTRPGTAGADTVMLGIKAGIHLPGFPIKPYLQASGGYINTRTTDTTVYLGQSANGSTLSTQFVGYEILGGIDYPVRHFLDLRIVEVGGGTGYGIGQVKNYFGINTGTQPITLFTVNTGIVLHF